MKAGFFQSIRWRLQLWHGLLLLAALVALWLGVLYLALERRNIVADKRLGRAMSGVIPAIRARNAGADAEAYEIRMPGDVRALRLAGRRALLLPRLAARRARARALRARAHSRVRRGKSARRQSRRQRPVGNDARYKRPPRARAAHFAHIFDRFHRVDESRTDAHFGLGLSIAKAIADAHGATLEVESTQGQGSTFTLRLS